MPPPRGNVLHGQAGLRTEPMRDGVDGMRRRAAEGLWVALLLAILAFLVVYPVLMLLLGALTDTNPVIDGFGVFRLSIANFTTVLSNPNVGEALVNTLIACGGGTAVAVAIGLTFSWIVVRTNTPCKGFIAAVSMLPLFAPPLVAGIAWVILGSPKTGLINTMFKWIGLDWRVDFYTLSGLIFVFGVYYAPYVYMFTASALRNMDPSLEEAAEVAGASAFATLFSVTFPLIMPAIISGMLLSFIVMLGIYGIPAVLGAPANINVLTTYIFRLTNWSPPLYNTAAAVAILLMVVTGILVYVQQKVLTGRSYTTVAGKAFRPRNLDLGSWRWFTFGLAMVYLFIVVVLPLAALIVAAFRKFMFIRDAASLFDMRQYSLDAFQQHLRQPADAALDLQRGGSRNHHGAGRRRAGLRHRLHHPPHASARPPLDRPAVDAAGRDPGPGDRRRLSVGMDRAARRALRHHLDIGARLHRPLHAGYGESAVDLVPADPSRAGGGGVAVRQGHARQHPHHHAALGAARRDRGDDAAVRAGDPRARLLAVSLHQQHHGDVGAAAGLLRGRQYRQDRGVQPGADRAARRADRACQLAVEGRVARRASAEPDKTREDSRDE